MPLLSSTKKRRFHSRRSPPLFFFSRYPCFSTVSCAPLLAAVALMWRSTSVLTPAAAPDIPEYNA